MRPQPDQVIGSKYRVIRLIGDGGMGAVYEARHEVLGSQVALKFLHPELAKRPGLVSRFMQEAKVSASIQSPHVTRVTDVDQTADGAAYIVMELLSGETLQAVLDRQRKLPRDQAIDYALQMLSGLEAAHALGVVHRDLKPDNVFITQTTHGPVLKLLDFGIAKLRASSEYQKGLTRPGAIMGTPEYMAPEQAESADRVDHRADLYALGAILYELLTGERPAYGDDAAIIIAQVKSGQVRSLAELDPTAPAELVGIVHRALSPRPEDRFSSAMEMRLALASLAGELSHAGRLAATPAPASTPAPAQGSTVDAPPPNLGKVAPTWPPNDGATTNRDPRGPGGTAVTDDMPPLQQKGGTQEVAPALVQQQIAKVTGELQQHPGSPPAGASGPYGGMPQTGYIPQAHAPAPPPPKSRWGLWAVIALLLGVAITAGVIGVVQYQNGDDDLPPSPTPFGSPPPATTITAQGPQSPDPSPGTLPTPSPTPAPGPSPGPGPSPSPGPRPTADAGAPADGGAKEAGAPNFPFPIPSSIPPFPSSLPPIPTGLPSTFPPFPGFPQPQPQNQP